MNVGQLKRSADHILEDWGIDVDRSRDDVPVLALDQGFVENWLRDLNLLHGAVSRLADGGRLTIGSAATPFTHGVGTQRNATESPYMGRPDFIVTQGQPKLLELNADSSVGGLYEIGLLASLYQKSGCFHDSLRFRSPIEAFAAYLKPLLQNPDRIAVLVSSRSFSRYYQRVERGLASALEALLHREFFVAYPDELSVRRYVEYQQREVAVVVKLDTMIAENKQSDLADFLHRSTNSQTFIVSDNRYVNVEDKVSVAVLWHLAQSKDASLSEAERAAIERLVTPSWHLASQPPPSRKTWSSELIDNKDRYVLKRVFSFGGGHVVAGYSTSSDAWAETVDLALSCPELWVAQHFVDGDRIVFDRWKGSFDTSGITTQGDRCIVSPFVFGTEIGGFLCRVICSESDTVVGLQTSVRMGLYLVAEEN